MPSYLKNGNNNYAHCCIRTRLLFVLKGTELLHVHLCVCVCVVAQKLFPGQELLVDFRETEHIISNFC